MRAALLLVAALAAASACKEEGQSFAEGMQIVCEAPSNVPGTTAAQKATAVAAHIDQNVSNEEVKKTIREISLAKGNAKRRMLDEAARRAGLDRCELAELWEMPATVPPGYEPPPAESPAAEEPGAAEQAAGEPEAEGPKAPGEPATEEQQEAGEAAAGN